MKKIYPIFLFLSLLLLSNAASGQTNLLFAGDFTNDADSLLIEYLKDAGYTVTDTTGADLNVMTEASAYTDFDVIFISEIIGSSQANPFAAAGYPIPCVTTEGYVARVGRWDWIESNEEEFLQIDNPSTNPPAVDLDDGVKTLIIDDEEHYITKWYGLEAEVDWTTIPQVDASGNEVAVTGMNLDQTMSGAIQLAHFNNAAMEQFPSMWAVPAGSSVNHTGVGINSNIVVLGIHQNGLTGRYATPEYHDLIKRSLEWVTDNLSSVEDFTDNMGNDLKIMPNPTSGIVNLSFALNTSGKVQIDVYDITGKRVESIESGYLGAGNNTLTLDFTGKSNGQYIVSLITDNNVLTRKILKTK